MWCRIQAGGRDQESRSVSEASGGRETWLGVLGQGKGNRKGEGRFGGCVGEKIGKSWLLCCYGVYEPVFSRRCAALGNFKQENVKFC